MQFSKKIFYAIFLTSTIISVICTIVIYSFLKNTANQEYISRYESLGATLANTFRQMEISADLINENAARVLYEIEKNTGLPGDGRLLNLAKTLGIKAFYTTNVNGKFIRSTDLPLRLQKNSIFTYCKKYKLLINGDSRIYRTPIIPGFPYNIPMKLTMIPNYNRTLILESGIELEYIGKILHQAIKNDNSIKSIGFYTPTGFELGYISESGKYQRGRLGSALNINEPSHKIINENTAVFNVKIPSIDQYCCECTYKKVSGFDGKYFYILHMEVSLDPLKHKIRLMQNNIILILFFSFILSLICSKFLARKLVSRILKIHETAKSVLKSGNLDIRVNIDNQFDEVSMLARTFNTMLDALKGNQARIVEIEKMKIMINIAGQVAHDIRSPLAVIDIVSAMISSMIPEKQQKMLLDAAQNVRDTANNLLLRYRQSEKLVIDQCNIEINKYVLFPSMIEMLVMQKNKEWEHNPCQVQVIIEPDANFFWINLAANKVKCMLSNLLNNSYEALDHCRDLQLRISVINHHLQLEIVDSGRGVPDDKINDVLNGVSLKHDGRGFGLSTARDYMEAIGGNLSLISGQMRGTKIILSFPFIQQPKWATKIVLVPKFGSIIMFGDLSRMRNIWDYSKCFVDAELLSFTTVDEVMTWYITNLNVRDYSIYLFDYDQIDVRNNWLQLLTKINVRSRGYLLSNYHDDVNVQRQCNEAGVGLIPKHLVNEVVFKRQHSV